MNLEFPKEPWKQAAPPLPDDPLARGALHVARTLREAGYEALLAGGCVRDLLLGRAPKDYDIATSARPEEVRALFPRTVPVGVQFGVVLVLLPSEKEGEPPLEYQVATFRRDGPYRDGRHPSEVRFTDAREDALRRDFTINAMFLDPAEGTILDYVGGRGDLKQGVIAAVGEPSRRFEEDKLRMLRAVRFAARFGFPVARPVRAAIRELAPKIGEVSPERVRDELTEILTQGRARAGFELLDSLGLLREVLPEIPRMKGVEQPPEFHPEGDVWVHTMLLLDMLEKPSPELAFGALLHDVGKPDTFRVAERIRFDGHAELGARMADGICARLRFSGASRDQVTSLVAHHMHFKDARAMREATLKRFLRLPKFEEHLALHRIDCLGSHGDLSAHRFCAERLEAFRRADLERALRPEPLLTGRDLIRLGYAPGPRFKEILTALEDEQLEGRLRDARDAESFVRERFPAA